MSRNEKDNFVATKAEKTFDDDGNIQVAKVIKIDDKLLLKKLEDTGGNIRKSKLLNKRIFDTVGRKKWNKYKNK
jgi:hypothetical protein